MNNETLKQDPCENCDLRKGFAIAFDMHFWGDEAGKLQHSDGVLFARCKAHNYLIDGRHTGWCPTENDFCSYGKRKEGAD